MRKEVESLIQSIQPVDLKVQEQAQKRMDSLTKPKGSLGRLEELAIKYVTARGTMEVGDIKTGVPIFCADHGFAKYNVSAYPQEVTIQMVQNYTQGGAGANVMTRHAGSDMKVIDVGIKTPVDHPMVENYAVVRETADFTQGPAMTEEQVCQAILVGKKVADELIDDGANLLYMGEMGIGNTTSSAALYATYLDMPVEAVTGKGSGINDARLLTKIDVIKKALEANRGMLDDPLKILQALGGLEIAAITGYVLAACARNIPLVIDGYISSAATLAAYKMQPLVMDYIFFSHHSADTGYNGFVEATKISPVVNLGLRLGEASGAAVVVNIVEAAVKVLTRMASFDEAGVSEKL